MNKEQIKMENTPKPPRTTTIRIAEETQKKLKEFADKNGLKLASMNTRALERVLQDHPELFLP